MARILLVAENSAGGLRQHMTLAGFRVELIEQHRASDVAVVVDTFDALLVDARSVDHELDIVRAVRRSGNLVPIVVVSDDAQDEYRAQALDAGADSVFVRPFSPIVLVAQVHAHVRRSTWRSWGPVEDPRDGASGLCINVRERSIFDNDKRIFLTPRENAVLRALAYRQGRYVSTENLLRTVWGEDCTNVHLVASCVRQVRVRLSEFGSTHLLQSRRGYGYRLSKQAIVVTGASKLPTPRHPTRDVVAPSGDPRAG